MKHISESVKGAMAALEEKILVEVQLPFSGFYHSVHSQIIDDELEQAFQYNDQGDSNVPYNDTDFDLSGMYDDYAAEYVSQFIHHVEQETGVDMQADFSGMSSPREYNFTTDRLFVKMPLSVIRAMWEELKADSIANGTGYLKDMIEARHSHGPGFISHYSNKYDDWLEKDLIDYDHNELMTVLMAWLDMKELLDGDDIGQGYENPVAQAMYENGNVNGIVWNRLSADQRLFAEAQQLAGRGLSFSDMVEIPEYAAYLKNKVDIDDSDIMDLADFLGVPESEIPYRCPETLDLFK